MADRKPKRGHITRYGEGSFKWVPARNLWVGRYDTGTLTPRGTRLIITASSRDEDTAWQAFTAKKKDFMLHGARPADVSASQTVKGWAKIWLENHTGDVRSGSYATDKSAVNVWIIPTIGTVKLEALTAAHMRAVGKAVTDAGRSGSTANGAQRVLNKMLNAAKADGYRIPDRVFAARKSSVGVTTRSRMSREEVQAVFRFLYTAYPDAVRFFLAVLYGSRKGEVLGLELARCIFYPDPEPGAVVVGEIDLSWQIQALRYKNRSTGEFHIKDGDEVRHIVDAWHFTRPKTAAGVRTLPIIAPVAKELRAWIEKCPIGDANPYGLLFPRIRGAADKLGYPRNRKTDLDEWKAAQKAAGVYKRRPDPAVDGDEGEFYVLHEARHSMISMLADARVPRHIIEMLVGQTELVDSYVHGELESAGQYVSSALSDLLPNAIGGSTPQD